jgi:hypothetical protein
MDFQELMARIAELDKPVTEAEKSKKDYDGDGKIESPKDEVWGSRAKAAAKSGKPFKEETVDETFEQGIQEIADEVEECGGMMAPMSSMSPKQSDNVSMNISMNGSGSGGIRDLMDILRNLEQGGSSDHDHDDSGDDGIHAPMLIAKDTMMGDDYDNSPDPVTMGTDAVVASGNDLHKAKDSFSDKPYRGDNPMAVEGIKNRLDSLYQEVKSR